MPDLVTLRLAYERAVSDREAAHQDYLNKLEAARRARDDLAAAGGLDCENRCGRLANVKHRCGRWYCSAECHAKACGGAEPEREESGSGPC